MYYSLFTPLLYSHNKNKLLLFIYQLQDIFIIFYNNYIVLYILNVLIYRVLINYKINKDKEKKGEKMKTNDIKKYTKIRTKQLGVIVGGIMMDNMRGNTRLIETFGSEVGLFDEIGSVYATDIVMAENSEGTWEDVEYTDKQIKSIQTREQFGF